jgi:hypothetical protein
MMRGPIAAGLEWSVAGADDSITRAEIEDGS